MKKGAVLQCINLSKNFGDKQVLDSLNLEIETGEILGVIGLSGSGKTTLLYSIIGYYEPDEGDVIFHENGVPLSVFTNRRYINPVFGFAPQTPSFYPKLTTEENLYHFGVLYNIPKASIIGQIDKLLALTNLDASRKTLAQNLSFGMQKRLGISCSIIHKPNILIMDEPTADLDPIRRKETWDLVRSINKAGTTVIIASHLLDEVEAVCNRVVLLSNGKVSDLGNRTKNACYELRLQTALGKYDKIKKELKQKRYKTSHFEIDGKFLKVETAAPEDVLLLLSHHAKRSKDRIIDITFGQPKLEQLFKNASMGKERSLTQLDAYIKNAIGKKKTKKYIIAQMEKKWPENLIDERYQALKESKASK